MTSQPGESPSHRIGIPCGDDVRTGRPRPGADRRALLQRRPDDDRTTRLEERYLRCRAFHAAPMGAAARNLISLTRSDRNRKP